MKNVIFILATLFIVSVNGQEYKVEYHKFEEELNKKSPITSDGSYYYTYYQVDMNSGDSIILKTYSYDFTPYVIIAYPDSTKEQTAVNPKSGTKTIEYAFSADEKGTYTLFVMCDSYASGSFTCEIWYSNITALHLYDWADFCGGLNFLLVHQPSGYRFLKGKAEEYSSYELNQKILTESEIISGYSDESYRSYPYKGNDREAAIEAYRKFYEALPACLSDEWTKEEQETGTYDFLGLIYYNEKNLWTKPIEKGYLILDLQYTDYTDERNAEGEVENDYEVQFQIWIKSGDD